MSRDKIKDSFNKVRQDINYLYYEIQQIKADLEEHNQLISDLIKRTLKNTLLDQTEQETISTLQQIIPTHSNTPTHNLSLQAPSTRNKGVSTGNEGVPTDRQTHQQTDRHIKKFGLNEDFDKIDHLEKASELLNSLDELKKEVRIKFKKLTQQEMIVFSTLYQMEEENLQTDYQTLAKKLHLSESSVRDYIGKIAKKGIPILKTKHNNKKITLSISKDLKKMASLNTIIQLREL